MHNLLLFDVGDRPIGVDTVDRVFQSVAGFRDVRRNLPDGTPIEADFMDGVDFTIVRLNRNKIRFQFAGRLAQLLVRRGFCNGT